MIVIYITLGQLLVHSSMVDKEVEIAEIFHRLLDGLGKVGGVGKRV